MSSYKITLPAGSTWSVDTEYDGQVVLNVVSTSEPRAIRVESLALFDSRSPRRTSSSSSKLSPKKPSLKAASKLPLSSSSAKRRLSFSSLDEVVDDSYGAPYSHSSEHIKPTQEELDRVNAIIRKSRERSLSSSEDRLSSAPRYSPRSAPSLRESPTRRSPTRSSAASRSPSRVTSSSKLSPTRAASSAASRSPSRSSSASSRLSPSRSASRFSPRRSSSPSR